MNLEKAIRSSWSKETAYPGCQNDWHQENPSLGQCTVTALLIQDLLGGEILFNREFHHYWNRLPGGRPMDLTFEQFHHEGDIHPDGVATREYLLDSERATAARTRERYDILRARVLSKWTRGNHVQSVGLSGNLVMVEQEA